MAGAAPPPRPARQSETRRPRTLPMGGAEAKKGGRWGGRGAKCVEGTASSLALSESIKSKVTREPVRHTARACEGPPVHCGADTVQTWLG